MDCTFLDRFAGHILVELPNNEGQRLLLKSLWPGEFAEGTDIKLTFDYRGQVKAAEELPTTMSTTPVQLTFVSKMGLDLLFRTAEREHVLLTRARVAGVPMRLSIAGSGFRRFETNFEGRVSRMDFYPPDVPLRRFEG